MPATEKHYSLSDERGRLDVRFRVDSGAVIDFSVQLSLLWEGTLHPVIRYDSAHGTVHAHKFWTSDPVREREELAIDDDGEGLTYALDDIEARWETYLDLFEQYGLEDR